MSFWSSPAPETEMKTVAFALMRPWRNFNSVTAVGPYYSSMRIIYSSTKYGTTVRRLGLSVTPAKASNCAHWVVTTATALRGVPGAMSTVQVARVAPGVDSYALLQAGVSSHRMLWA